MLVEFCFPLVVEYYEVPANGPDDPTRVYICLRVIWCQWNAAFQIGWLFVTLNSSNAQTTYQHILFLIRSHRIEISLMLNSILLCILLISQKTHHALPGPVIY